MTERIKAKNQEKPLPDTNIYFDKKPTNLQKFFEMKKDENVNITTDKGNSLMEDFAQESKFVVKNVLEMSFLLQDSYTVEVVKEKKEFTLVHTQTGDCYQVVTIPVQGNPEKAFF